MERICVVESGLFLRVGKKGVLESSVRTDIPGNIWIAKCCIVQPKDCKVRR